MSVFWPALGLGVALLIGVLEALRRRYLREQYAVAWILAALVLLGLAAAPPLRPLRALADAIGLAPGGPSLILLAALLVTFGLQFHLTVVLGRLTDRSTALAQEVALLRQALEEGAAASEVPVAPPGEQPGLPRPGLGGSARLGRRRPPAS